MFGWTQATAPAPGSKVFCFFSKKKAFLACTRLNIDAGWYLSNRTGFLACWQNWLGGCGGSQRSTHDDGHADRLKQRELFAEEHQTE